jgi:hypothetical protein
MNLALPLLIMTAILLSAVGLGAVMRGKDPQTQIIAGAIGLGILFLLPLVYDASTFDGNCFGVDGSKFACSMGERLIMSFRAGMAFMLAPALLWVLAYSWSKNQPNGGTSKR